MIHANDPEPPPHSGRELLITVVSAGLCTLASALASWWVDHLREKYGRTKPEPAQDDWGSSVPRTVEPSGWSRVAGEGLLCRSCGSKCSHAVAKAREEAKGRR